ncbi:alpha/beta fold hydrolase [Bacillus sonorensis]|uniref:alpha/beta hydrolase n=1 Tax=Bacillus sonorensis TaxID=119858 RepID=UPI000495EE7C|nr:alpha/beta fold hydrolase [Bacillus sonorensis]MEC1353615.1 alpha/beta fold hydrolase [Bacillus sonorensis]MEC1425573.1 alpha/beta fold hydrolase [Bacillus sonorensis]MEC1591803.1 alpha/beta fold hydrolase [Bacillus sonorensis]
MIGCLCIHGFTGAPYEIEPLAAHLKQAGDWKIEMITLPGHGDIPVLKGVCYQEWIACAEVELIRLLKECDDVYVIGFSMGGMIAAYLAGKYPVSRLVLLSAAARYISPAQLIQDLKTVIKDTFQGSLEDNQLYKRYKKKLTNTPVSSALQFHKLVKATKPALKKLRIPVLIVQGERDSIVPVSSAFYLYETIPSNEKKLCLLPESHHHICLEENTSFLFHTVEAFLKRS